MTPPDNLSHLTEQERRDWELAQKATPGPWSISQYENFHGFSIWASGSGCIAERWWPSATTDIPIRDNAEFITAARTGYPAALEKVDDLSGKLESAESRLRDLLEADVTRARDICRLTIERDQAEQEIDRLNTVERDLREKVGWTIKQLQAVPTHHRTANEDAILAALLEGQHG